MPFTPVTALNLECLRLTAETLCRVFDIESLHPYQEESGQNILKGTSTVLDVPTGGGKTLAFWNLLFYHWQPGNIGRDSQKIVLVVGLLIALLEEQAKNLNVKGIPAVLLYPVPTLVQLQTYSSPLRQHRTSSPSGVALQSSQDFNSVLRTYMGFYTMKDY
jgi:superfamily II DNA helicase RecQ